MKAILILITLIGTLQASTMWKGEIDMDNMTGKARLGSMRVNSQKEISLSHGRRGRVTLWIFCDGEKITAAYSLSRGYWDRDMNSSRIIVDRGDVETVTGSVFNYDDPFFTWDNINMARIEEFKNSVILKIEFSPWKTWNQTATFDMTGFAKAYNKIRSMCPEGEYRD